MTVNVAILIIRSSNICMKISRVNHYLLLLLSHSVVSDSQRPRGVLQARALERVAISFSNA